MSAPEPIILKLIDNQAIDQSLMKSWSAALQAAPPACQVMVDASAVPPLKEDDLKLISSTLLAIAKERHYEVVLICPRETEVLLARMDLQDKIKCFHVHGKVSPEPVVKPGELGKEAKQELSLFFAHLCGSLQRISSQLFSTEMKFQSPLEVFSGAPKLKDINPSIALTRADSGSFHYVVMLLVGQKEKAIFAERLFKGLKVSEAALRDLLPEFLNNIMGNLVSHLSTSQPPMSLNSKIPEPSSSEAAFSALENSGTKVRLQFKHDQLSMSVVVGYSQR